MFSLIRKDLIFARRTFWVFGLTLLGLLLLYGWRGMSAGSYVVFGCLVSAMAPVSALATEDKFRALAYACSLPVRRDDIVLAKYLSAWLAGLAGYLALNVVGLLMPRTSLDAAALLRVEMFCNALLTMALVIGLLLPFTLRFGLIGLLLFGVFAQVLGALALVLTVASPQWFNLQAMLGALADGRAALRAHWGATGYWLILLSAAGLVNLFSFLISRALFRRRDF